MSSALGNGGRAAVDEIDGPYLNPASLSHIRNRAIMASHLGDFGTAYGLLDNGPGAIIAAQIMVLSDYDLRLSLGQLIGVKTSIGATFKQINSKTNADLGILHTPLPNWGVGIVFYDMDSGATVKSSFGFGINYIFNDFFRTRLDRLETFDGLSRIQLGVESYVNPWTAIRWGVEKGITQTWTLGGGFRGPRFYINYAYQNPQEQKDNHRVDLVIPF